MNDAVARVWPTRPRTKSRRTISRETESRPPLVVSVKAGSFAYQTEALRLNLYCGEKKYGSMKLARTPRSSDDHLPSKPIVRAPPKKLTCRQLIVPRACSSDP